MSLMSLPYCNPLAGVLLEESFLPCQISAMNNFSVGNINGKGLQLFIMNYWGQKTVKQFLNFMGMLLELIKNK